MSSNKKQKTQQNECVSPDTNLPSSSILIPEDIIREYILPYMVHLKQVDDVIKQIQEDGAGTGKIVQIFCERAKRGELSGVHYIISKYSDSLTRHGVHDAFYGACGNGYLKIVRYFCELKDDITNDSLNHAKFASNNLNKNIKLHFHDILTS